MSAMNIDYTNLLKALKGEKPHDIPDWEKREVAEEHHEWLTEKTKEDGSIR